MIINSPELPPVLVDEYHFVFTDGTTTSIFMTKDLGDKVDWDISPMSVKFDLVAKPDRMDPTHKHNAEEITIFMGHVLIVSHKVHEERPISVEERTNLRETIDLMAQAPWKTPQ